jgi:SAM-dependent methyltransferase
LQWRGTTKLGARADVRVGEAEQLPWPAGQFDVVLCGDSFRPYPQPHAALTEMRRVLRPGGLLLLGDLWFPAPVRVVANWLLPPGASGDVHIYSEKELRVLLQAGGFGCIQWELVTQSACLVTATAA